MCGRYTISIDEQEIRDIVNAITQQHPGAEVKTGEIYPTNPAPVLLAVQDGIRPEVAVWGFPNFRSKSGVIINARAETALNKKTFRESLLTRRCVIPSTGFFEWTKDARKQKYLFRESGNPLLYMAGFYNDYGGERRYVILTTDANQSVREIHNRMPIIVHRQEIDDWVENETATQKILERVPPSLKPIAISAKIS